MAEQYPADVIVRAAKRLFALAEEVEPGVFDLEHFQEKVAAEPDFVTDEDRLRCEYFAEAGCHYDENGNPTCNEPVTMAVWSCEDGGPMYACNAHAQEWSQEDHFIRMKPLRPLPEEAANA